MRTFIINGKITTPVTTLTNHTLIIEDQKIVSITSGEVLAGDNDRVIDGRGYWVTPGLIDVHVHGAMGHDTMDATPEAIKAMGSYFASHGVTSYLPTTMSSTPEGIKRAIDNLVDCPKFDNGAHHMGVHVEGPYLNPEYKGAQSEHILRDADSSEYEYWLDSGVLKLVSLAPERFGSQAFIDRGIMEGIEFSLAHSGATYEQVIEAANHGLRQATHVFNGMMGLHHRRPGTVGGVLSDQRIYAQLIADGIHVHPSVVDLMVRAKGVSRTILITDAIRAAGLEDGEYDLGVDKIFVKDGVSRTAQGGLAGSTLTLDAAIRNVIQFTGLSFEEALPMATSVPAKAMGWLDKKGELKPGADADIAMFDQDLFVRLAMVSGRVVYQD